MQEGAYVVVVDLTDVADATIEREQGTSVVSTVL